MDQELKTQLDRIEAHQALLDQKLEYVINSVEDAFKAVAESPMLRNMFKL
jgi:hypothetical protein